jgi:hypothetical protein
MVPNVFMKAGIIECAAHRPDAGMSALGASGEDPLAVSMKRPSPTHGGQKSGRKGDEPLFVPLADDAEHAVRGVNLLGPQGGGLADPQAADVHHGQANTVYRVMNGIEDTPALGVAGGLG